MKDFDPVDHAMLSALQDDARMTMRELGQRVGLSGPAAAERMRRLEEQGVVSGSAAAEEYGRRDTVSLG